MPSCHHSTKFRWLSCAVSAHQQMMASGAGGDVMQQFGISGVQGPQSKPVLMHYAGPGL